VFPLVDSLNRSGLIRKRQIITLLTGTANAAFLCSIQWLIPDYQKNRNQDSGSRNQLAFLVFSAALKSSQTFCETACHQWFR
jgi:hypothetical protein